MRTFSFYYDLLSPPSRALLVFFDVTKTKYTGVKVALRKGEHLTPEFAKTVNRFKKVPAIVDGDFKLAESCAILNYLRNEKLIPPTPLIPSDTKTFAVMDEYLQWTHNNIRVSAYLWFRTQWIQPFFTGEFGDKKEIESYKKMYEGHLDVIENIWLDQKKFIVGDQMTFADILAASDIEQIRVCGYNPVENRPKLKAWLDEVKAQTNPHYSNALKIVYQYEEKYKGMPPIRIE